MIFQLPDKIRNTYFGGAYSIEPKEIKERVTRYGIEYVSQLLGREIYLPVTLECKNEVLRLEACTISLSGTKTIIKTKLSERVGSVKEQFNIDEYKFNIKGVFINRDDGFPEDEVSMLQRFYESTKPVTMTNALVDLIIPSPTRICIETLQLMGEVVSKSYRHVPYEFVATSDTIDTLVVV